MGDRGEFRERIIKRFLRPCLPECFGLGSGSALAADGTGSRQLDVILSDSVFPKVLCADAKHSLFPGESVFGVIEVTSKLTCAELETSMENIQSRKELTRQPLDMLDFLPYRRIEAGAGLTYDRRCRNPYMGVCFALDGIQGRVTVHGPGSGTFFGPSARSSEVAQAEYMYLTPANPAKCSAGV
jgi:hypothetical protein